MIQIFAFFFSLTTFALPQPSLIQLSKDPYTNAEDYHSTEVEPSSFAYGSTIVTAFQVGRNAKGVGGATNIGWATSKDGGNTWTNGFLTGTTTSAGGRYDHVSDVYVAYDAKHDVWMMSIMSLMSSIVPHYLPMLVAKSYDGGITWTVDEMRRNDSDGTSIICDNSSSSNYFGNCYLFYDWGANVATSDDGGTTWSDTVSTGLGGTLFPAILPDGTVLIGQTSISASHDGGKTWRAQITVMDHHEKVEPIRSNLSPNFGVDRNGKMYFVISDCRFESGCSSNDLVFTASDDSSHWSEPVQIPLNMGKQMDYFTPALAVDPTTAGTRAHLAVVYYYMESNCSGDDCNLSVGFTFSSDGGKHWSEGEALGGPMKLSWLPRTNHVGDYIGISFSQGVAFPFFALANEPSGNNLDESIYTYRRAIQ